MTGKSKPSDFVEVVKAKVGEVGETGRANCRRSSSGERGCREGSSI
jgi:hypothetical protein